MKKEARIGLQVGLITLGASLIILGIIGGDLPVVLSKAIFICLECIGIG